nr:acetylserotonin O-methyltransferase isoform X2 [Globicephala melas]
MHAPSPWRVPLVLKRIEAESGFCRCPEVLFSACELGVFDLLAEVLEALGSAAVAARLGVSSRGTELLLHACVSLKLLQVEVRREKAVYENTELASTYLARASPKSQQDMLLYAARTTYLGWGHLAARLSEPNATSLDLGIRSRCVRSPGVDRRDYSNDVVMRILVLQESPGEAGVPQGKAGR